MTEELKIRQMASEAIVAAMELELRACRRHQRVMTTSRKQTKEGIVGSIDVNNAPAMQPAPQANTGIQISEVPLIFGCQHVELPLLLIDARSHPSHHTGYSVKRNAAHPGGSASGGNRYRSDICLFKSYSMVD